MHSHTLTRLTSYYIHGSTVSKQYSSAHVDVEFFHYYIDCWTDDFSRPRPTIEAGRPRTAHSAAAATAAATL